jgi:hypothetical protein
MVFVMGSVIVTSRHLQTLNLPRLVVGFGGELVSSIGMLACSFRMPVADRIVTLFVVLGNSTVGISVLGSGAPPKRKQWMYRAEA